jgi:3-methyladenine DNA glycosylase/8-oxoguanine DNA glycosylase
MPLDDDSCYRAMKARDARFDGRFLVAVSSTRIYCRPVCTSPTPKRENCRFYPDVAAAEAAGYRACLRCRPRLFQAGISDEAANGIKVSRPRPRSSANHVFELNYRPPYDWQVMLAFLAARAVSGVEEVTGDSYRRTVRVSPGGREYSGWIEVAPAGGKTALRTSASSSLTDILPEVARRVKRLMDVSSNPTEIAAGLGPIAESNPGLRVPGAFDGFEIAVRAVLGQQITVAAARTVSSRFAAAFGTPIKSPFSALKVSFPAPEKVAGLTIDNISSLGILAARSRSIIALGRAIADQSIRLSASTDVQAELDKLRALPGIGEWTAQYIAMRALNWPDAFPHTDYGVMKALGETNPKRVLEVSQPWRPWRSYAVMHLWQSLHQTERMHNRKTKHTVEAPVLRTNGTKGLPRRNEVRAHSSARNSFAR